MRSKSEEFNKEWYLQGEETHFPAQLQKRLLTGLLRGFPGGAGGKEPAYQCRRHERRRFNPWVRKIPWRRAWQPKYSCLKNPMDRGACRATVHRIAQSWTRLKQLSLHRQGFYASVCHDRCLGQEVYPQQSQTPRKSPEMQERSGSNRN